MCCQTTTVVTYGLRKSDSAIVNAAVKRIHVELAIAQHGYDLIAFPCFLRIINPSALTVSDRLLLDSYLNDIDDKSAESIIFTSPPSFPLTTALTKISTILVPFSVNRLHFILLKRRGIVRRGNRRSQRYDKTLFRLFSILRTLQRVGDLRPDEACAEFNISRKTLQRDIALLQQTGEMIEYDHQHGAYHFIYNTCMADMS